jgi:nicotinate-nucleotide adenylyltransferase
VSARGVRERLAAGESVRDQVPPAVAEYIAQHGLYREPA